MKNSFSSMAFLLLSTIAIGQTAQMARDAENIQNLLSALSMAWNDHDAKAFSMLFAEDADFTNQQGLYAHGRAQIDELQKKSFAARFKNSSLKITDKKIRFITADITAVDASWEMTGAENPDGKNIPLRKGLLNFIMTRGDDKWFITVLHNMDLSTGQ